MPLVVTDNAKGINKDDLPFIFEPYFSTKFEKNGVGLGLFFVKTQLDNALQGSIEVTQNEGTTSFSVTLPKILC